MAIDYQILIDEAMLDIVKKILKQTQEEGLEDEQSLYVSFRTDFPEVILSKSIKARYPKEITIVLQYQYKNLRVLQDSFSVNIAFNGISETIEIPFFALTSFADPSADFSLQFRTIKNKHNRFKNNAAVELSKMPPKAEKKQVNQKTDIQKEAGKVVSLEQFRNKSK